jgi:hypothetical protein
MGILEEIGNLKHRRILHIPLKKYGFKKLCEVGVRAGRNLADLLKADPEVMVAVDAWRNDGVPGHNDSFLSQRLLDHYYQDICSWRERHPCLAVVRAYSAAAAQQFADGYFDFVYLDADHTYEGITADLASWWPKVRVGGILSGHDYIDNYTHQGVTFWVKRGVDEFRAAHHIGDERFRTVPKVGRGASWFILK